MSVRELLRSIGERIRTARELGELTQRELGERAGIVGKYVSEIERGTRDVPLSTLHAVVERGLQRRLEISFRDRRAAADAVQLPVSVDELAIAIASLPEPTRRKVVALVHMILEAVRG